MRWGIPAQAKDDHSIVKLCIDEIHNCQEQSIGPNFVVSTKAHAEACQFCMGSVQVGIIPIPAELCDLGNARDELTKQKYQH